MPSVAARPARERSIPVSPTPHTTPHDAKHGPPRDDSKDGPGAGGDGDGAKGDPPQPVADPVLAVMWGDAPAITGDLGPAPAGGSSSASAPDHNAFSVDLGGIRDAENTMLGAERTAISAYESVRQRVANDINGGEVFGQQATQGGEEAHDEFFAPSQGTRHVNAVPPGPDQPIRDAANEYAAYMNPAMMAVLREIADAIENTGRFVAMLNRAGQLYAHADQESFFPDPPPNPLKK
nr:hypothetical protein [Streptomyces sp. SID5468]